MKSSSKNADIYVLPCPQGSPLHRSCSDAYEYTWRNDFKGEIKSLSSINKDKLINSMGFCPHLRCQLGNVSNSAHNGGCPDGLCYTKLEDGGPSFGACCFKNGSFLSGNLIGHYHKTQKTPKPIYSHSRIVLGGDIADKSFESFINANYIHPNIIATQCPLIPSIYNRNGTINDMKRMIIEQNVSYWIQLAPDSHPFESIHINSSQTHSPVCTDFIFPYLGNASSPFSQGISDFKFLNEEAVMSNQSSHVHVSFTITAYIRSRGNGIYDTIFENPMGNNNNNNKNEGLEELMVTLSFDSSENHYSKIIFPPPPHTSPTPNNDKNTSLNGYNSAIPIPGINKEPWLKVTRNVDHIWYFKWKDFEIPPDEDDELILSIADSAAKVIRDKEGTIAISCKSGRGRTGTLAAIVLGRHKNIKTLDELTDIIVGFRHARDSMVEMPAQFRYISRLLQLGETNHCNLNCKLNNAFFDKLGFWDVNVSMNNSVGFDGKFHFYFGVVVGVFMTLTLLFVWHFVVGKFVRFKGDGNKLGTSKEILVPPTAPTTGENGDEDVPVMYTYAHKDLRKNM